MAMITRYRVETFSGLFWTGEQDFFTDECLDAAEFETEGDAFEACCDLDDVFVERFQKFPKSHSRVQTRGRWHEQDRNPNFGIAADLHRSRRRRIRPGLRWDEQR